MVGIAEVKTSAFDYPELCEIKILKIIIIKKQLFLTVICLMM